MKAIKQKRPPFGKYLKEQLKSRPAVTAVMALYFALCIASCIYCIVIRRSRDITYSLQFTLVIPAIYVGEYFFRQKTPIICVILILFWLAGSLTGAVYNIYTIVPVWDDIMHFLWGIVFVSVGFSVIKVFLGESDSNKKFFAFVLFAFAFCLLTAVFWEIYEFSTDRLNPNYDVQEDTLIENIYSFLLHEPYDHLNTEIIEGIAKTVLYDADGNVLYVIEGGYLDIGLFDTMWDFIWCTIASGAFCIALIIDRYCGKHLYNLTVPAVVQAVEKPAETAEEAEEESVAETENN